MSAKNKAGISLLAAILLLVGLMTVTMGQINNNGGGTGTVTNTGGSLTSNAVVLGNGGADTKVVAGLTTDGSSTYTAGASGGTAGCFSAFGTSSTATKICGVGNGTEWDATFATLHLPASGTYGVASGNATYTSAATTILSSGGGSWAITSSGGNLVQNTGKGQHVNTFGAGNDLAGTASGTTTTATVTFTTNYTSTPSCVITPTTAGVTSAIITSQANSGFTITYAPSGSTNFNYHCMGNPN